MSFGVRGLSAGFGDVEALRGVDVEVPRGSVAAVVGGDGAGKSTLLRCLVGKLSPTGGEVRRPPQRSIGYMPSTSGTWRQLTVEENIDFVGGAFAMRPADVRRRGSDLLDRAALTDASNRLSGDLSGGMRQKLGFVLAMLHDPELLVLDEPSTGVDPVSRIELWRLIAEAAAAGAAVVMATTYLDEAERANSVSVLDRGRIIASGSRDEVMGSFPGVITAPAEPHVVEHSWRRGRSIREWHPPGSVDDATSTLAIADLDFEDVVIARLLNDRLARSSDADGVTE